MTERKFVVVNKKDRNLRPCWHKDKLVLTEEEAITRVKAGLFPFSDYQVYELSPVEIKIGKEYLG